MPDERLDRERFEWEREKARIELELDRARFGLEQKKADEIPAVGIFPGAAWKSCATKTD